MAINSLLSSSVKDRRAGLLYGLAIGDALGIPIENRSASFIKENTTREELTRHRKTTRNGFGETWEAGDWSDDTNQALAILDGALSPSPLPFKGYEGRIARNFMDWYKYDGRGCGSLTRSVFSHDFYLLDPQSVSAKVHSELTKKRGFSPAPNGALMRTLVLALLPEDRWPLKDSIARVCRMTHHDPRCLYSCVVGTKTASNFLEGSFVVHSPAKPVSDEGYFDRVIANGIPSDIAALDLDSGLPAKGSPVGYTYRCLASALWAVEALRNDATPREIMETLYAAGGDTDTNGAVALGLIGAWVGKSGLPSDWVEGLQNKHILDGLLARVESTHEFGH